MKGSICKYCGKRIYASPPKEESWGTEVDPETRKEEDYHLRCKYEKIADEINRS